MMLSRPNGATYQGMDVRRDGIARLGVEPEGPRRHRDQLGLGARVTAREERDRMPAPHQLVTEVRDDALGAAVATGRDPLVQG